MKKANKEALAVSSCITSFVSDYAPKHKTDSSHTVKAYKTAIKLFLDFLEESGHVSPSSLCWSDFSRENIESWLEWLKEIRKNEPSSCNVRLASLREFLKYAGERDISVLSCYQCATSVKKLKAPRKKVSGLTKDAVKAIMAVPDTSTRTGRRDLAFMVLTYATAARIDEILSMKISQIHLEGKKPYVNVVGKGKKTRTLYILPKASRHLKVYIQEFHGDKPEPDAYLFYAKRTDTHQQLTQPAIDKRLKSIASVAHGICQDVPLNLHAHHFRHARASHWLEEGINIVQISFLLGHEQLQTTMVYLDITTDDEMKALEILETAEDKKVTPKWKEKGNSLAAFCNLK